MSLCVRCKRGKGEPGSRAGCFAATRSVQKQPLRSALTQRTRATPWTAVTKLCGAARAHTLTADSARGGEWMAARVTDFAPHCASAPLSLSLSFSMSESNNAAAACPTAAAAAATASASAAARPSALQPLHGQAAILHPGQPATPRPPAAASSLPALPSSPHSHMLLAGLASGVSVAGLFNPWDRALYLSVLHARPFLRRANFVHPYQGFWQVCVHRTLTGGLYFPLFDAAQPLARELITQGVGKSTSEAEQSALMHFACGNFAGGFSGVVLNGLTAVKYASWAASQHAPTRPPPGFLATARSMWSAGGLSPFTKGINATVARDTIFGGVFALTKFQLAMKLKPYIEEPAEPTNVVASRTTKVALHAKIQAKPDAGKHAQAAGTGSNQCTQQPEQNKPAADANIATHAPPAAAPRFQFSAGTVDFTAALIAGFAVSSIALACCRMRVICRLLRQLTSLFLSPSAQATILSAPLNYVRNIKYGWSAHSVPPGSVRILIDLAKEARAQGQEAPGFLQNRLRLGWGTARVAVGMAVGQYLYEFTKDALDKRDRKRKEQAAKRGTAPHH